MSPVPKVAISIFEGGWCFVHLPKSSVHIWVRVKPFGEHNEKALSQDLEKGSRFKIVEMKLVSPENAIDSNFWQTIPFNSIESIINRERDSLWKKWSSKAEFEQIEKARVPRVKFQKVKRLKLIRPKEWILSDDFFKRVSEFYIQSVEIGENPIVAISEEAGVAYKTAESWARKARVKGFLSRGDAGKVS